LLNEDIEKKLNRLALENNRKEVEVFFKKEIKNATLIHQFEFLFWVVDNKNIDILKFLLDYPQIDLHMFEDFCFRYSAGCGYLDLVKFFVRQGADIHSLKEGGFIWASANGHLNVLNYLATKKVNIHARFDQAMSLASKNGHLDVVKYLYNLGLDVKAGKNTPIKYASENGHIEIVHFLMQRGADYHVDDEYPLRKSPKNGHIELAREFLRRGSNPNANNYELLVWAIENRKLDILDMLLSAGGEADFWDRKYIKKAKDKKDFELKSLLESYLE